MEGHLKSTVASDFDILQWWKFHASEYPVSSEISRDTFAVSTSSVASENEILKIGYFAIDGRNRRRAIAASASLCLKTCYR